MLRIRINGESMIALSMYLLIFYLCIPFSMILLNSFLIRLIALVAAASFVLGMMLLKRVKELVVFFALFGFLVVYYLVTWRAMISSIFYPYYCFASLLFVFGGMALFSCEKKRLLRRLVIFITVVFVVTAITSIIGLRANPLAAREMARGSTYDLTQDFNESKYIYRKMNIVSWSQAYGMMFAIPIAMIMWKRKKKVRNLGYIILVLLMLASSQITFALLLSIVMLFATMITGENSAKRIIVKMIIGFLLIFLIIKREAVLELSVEISEKAGFDYLTRKLTDLKVLLLERRAIGDANERGELYRLSFDSFLKSPLLGVLGNGGKATTDTIGYHSEFIDMLGSFGLLGVAIILSAISGYAHYLHQIGKEYRKDLAIIFLGFIGLFIVNPVFHSPQVFVGAFLYPLLICRGYQLDEKHEVL